MESRDPHAVALSLNIAIENGLLLLWDLMDVLSIA